jgi:hypothetical protein
MGSSGTTPIAAERAATAVGGSASWAALVALVLVIALGAGLRIFARRVGHQRPWVPALELGWWTLGAALLLRLALVPWLPAARSLASAALLAVLAVSVWAGRELLAEALAAVALALAGRPRLGDAIVAAGHEGTVVAFGLTGVTLSVGEGREVTVPNRLLLLGPLERRASAGAEAPCLLSLPVPPGLPATRVLEVARQAALLSSFASAHRRPTVRLTADGEGRGLWLEVRGFAFDYPHRDDYLSDVLARLEEGLSHLREVEAAPERAQELRQG